MCPLWFSPCTLKFPYYFYTMLLIPKKCCTWTETHANVFLCLVSTLSLSPPGPLVQALKDLLRIPTLSACRTPALTYVCCRSQTEDFCGPVWHLGLHVASCPWSRGRVFVVIDNYILLILLHFVQILVKSVAKKMISENCVFWRKCDEGYFLLKTYYLFHFDEKYFL